jgi:putative peptide zinc metalloprotease protein
MPTYTRDTTVIVQPFTRQPDGDDVIIGRAETGVFLAVPAEAIELLEHLAQGKSIGDVADLYQQRYGEVPDLDDFLGLLEAKGIVKSRSAEPEGTNARQNVQPAVRLRYHFANFPQRLAQRLFGGPALVGYCVLTGLAIGLVALHPSLASGPRDLYFPDHRTLSWAVIAVASYGALFLHELGHLIAARARGINSRIGIGHRLWYLVAETDLTGLWTVPKRQRYMPMLAGILVDAVSGSLLVFLLFAGDEKWLLLPDFGARLLRAMVFTYVLRIVWQCFFFIRTDLYFVIANLFNCRNLLKDTETFLRNQLARALLFIRPVDQSAIPAAEQRIIRIYGFFWIAGRIAALSLLFAITLPLATRYIRSVGDAFRTGYSANPSNFVDAVLLAGYFLIPLTIGLIMWIGALLRRERT